MRRTRTRAALALALAAGCSLPDRAFEATPDAGSGDAAAGAPELVVSPAVLAVAEGDAGTITVRLRDEPPGTVTATVTSSDPDALPVSPATLTFTPADYAADHPITVRPPVDANTASETAVITLAIAGAGAGAGAVATTVMATATDGTIAQTWGWPTPFPSTILVPASTVLAYRVDVGAVASLDAFGAYVPTAAGQFRMALYTNAGNVPGTLVAEMGAGQTLVNGANTADLPADPLLVDASYFLVIRFSTDVNIGYAPAGVTGLQCIRNVNLPGISTPWPTTFGSAACATDRLVNLWIATYHQ